MGQHGIWGQWEQEGVLRSRKRLEVLAPERVTLSNRNLLGVPGQKSECDQNLMGRSFAK